MAAIAAPLLALAALFWPWRGPNLARHAIVTTSSVYTVCRDAADCGNSFFHTNNDDQPWITYDLGVERDVRRVEVENRTDCCHERAVPLVVETSGDGANWSEQGRAERAFATWSADFHARARYVRLRVDRQSYLHLRSVVIR
jgi:hypothetical protein